MRSERSAWASPGEVGRSELATRTQVHYWGSPLEREGSQAAQEATQKANISHKCTILNHHSFIRSFSRSPVRSHGSPLGREGSPHGAPYLTTIRCPLARSPNSLPCSSPFARSFANSRRTLAAGEREITHGHHHSLVGSPTHGSALGNEATQLRSQGSPLGKEGSQDAQEATQEAAQVHHTQPPFVRSLVRSFARSLASALSRLTTGKGRVTGDTGGYTSAPHSTTIRSLVRSFARSPVRSHGSPLGREGSPHGAPYSTNVRCQYSLPYSSPFDRSFANSRLALATGERETTHGRHRSLVARRLTARHWGMRRHNCTLRAHRWGRRGHRGHRRHRRRRKYAILNHHSFARSLIRSLADSCLTAHHCGGGVLRRAKLHHRSPACSPIHVSRLITGDGWSPLGNEATQVHYRGSLLGRVTGGAWRAPRPGRRPGWRTPRRGEAPPARARRAPRPGRRPGW